MPLRAIITSALACLAFALPATPVQADCVDDCQRSTYCDSAMYQTGECNDKLNQCYQLECDKSSEAFGAIAYGPDSQAFGYSYDSPDADSAASVAMNNCKKHGDDCQLVLNFSNSCGAVAAVDKSGGFDTGQGATKDQAEFNAMAACKKRGGGDNCQIQVWSCALPQ